ncbi:MAG: hypothetical protein VB934_06675 [Polyangiaceae bacterium]
MTKSRKNFAPMLIIGMLAMLTACAGAETETDDDSALRGKRGESCRARTDCESGLACISNVCGIESFNLAPSGKECVLVECRQADDCCPAPLPQCSGWQVDCSQGDTFACEQYNNFCVCDATKVTCVDNTCQQVCSATDPCPFGQICNAGKCGECATVADCAADETCTASKCVSKCSSNSDCAYFHSCQNAVCIDTGCTTNLECIAATQNVQASCGEAKCSVPCQTDLECGNPTNYNFQACVSGACIDIGCETDEQCRIAFMLPPSAGIEAECRTATP